MFYKSAHICKQTYSKWLWNYSETACSSFNRLRAAPMATPVRSQSQILDAGPRGGANMEAMSALSTGKKGKLHFFKGDESGTAIGSHTVFDFTGKVQDVGMVQVCTPHWSRPLHIRRLDPMAAFRASHRASTCTHS